MCLFFIVGLVVCWIVCVLCLSVYICLVVCSPVAVFGCIRVSMCMCKFVYLCVHIRLSVCCGLGCLRVCLFVSVRVHVVV